MSADQSSDERDPVERLAEEFVSRHRRGECPSPVEYAERHPQWAERINALFPALLLMEYHKLGVSESSGSPEEVVGAGPLKQLGDYRIIREVGRGGMAIVYEAEQESLGRHVALKVLLAHSRLNPEQTTRFQREARAAARLHHTNIVPVYGVGEHEGVLYYVMQFIPGQALDEVLHEVRRLRRQRATAQPQEADRPRSSRNGTVAASATDVAWELLTGRFAALDAGSGDSGPASDSARAPTGTIGELESPALRAEPRAPYVSPTLADDRSPSIGPPDSSSLSGPARSFWRGVARIGVQVAEALEYAHAQGVLHRDIKPSNLLLDLHGTVWVADFGLAKLADQADLTHTGDVVGTWRYMAPERLRGESDPRSDVYSLGLTIYELLALRPAFDGATREELIRQVSFGVPLSPRKVNPDVPRDLETIVLKAMEREPAGRYQTAGEMAADLRCFLEDRPPRARRSGPAERVWRWARRNPALAGMSAVAAVLLVAVASILAGATLLLMDVNRRERKARAEADANFRRTLDVVDRMTLRVGDDLVVNLPRAEPVRAQLLGEARNLLEQLLKEQPGNPVVQLVAGRFYARHEAKYYRDLNQLAAAELSMRRGIDLLAVLGGGPHARPGPCTELAYAYSMLGYILRDRSRLGEAREMGRRSIDLLEVAAARSLDPGPYLPELGSTLLRQGRILADLGQDQDAEAAFLRSLEVFEGLTKAHPGDARHRQGCARILHFLGWFCEEHIRYQEAERYYVRARDLREHLVKEFPDVVSYRYDLGDTYNNLVVLMKNSKRVEEVERYFDLLYRLEKGLAEEFPERPVYRAMLGLAQVNLVEAYLRAGRPSGRMRELLETAIADLRAAIALAGEADLMHSRWLAHAYCAQVKVFALLGQFSHANAAMRELLQIELPQGQHLYFAACAFGYAAPRARESTTLPRLQRTLLALFYRTRAMDLLGDAAKRGFATAARIKSDTDLDDLRALTEYRTLLVRLDQPATKVQPPDP
jgi:tetratricopeptide (TPR) repeat protein